MNDHLQAVTQAMEDRFEISYQDTYNQVSFIVPVERVLDACQVLRDEFGFTRLIDITAVDYWPQADPRFHVVYQFHSIPNNLRISLRVTVPGVSPLVPTLEKLYANANWYEREIWDMFGIRFEGHSDLRRIMMPEDWVGHPLRKDYPLGYEEVQYTFNFDKIDVRKPKPKE